MSNKAITTAPKLEDVVPKQYHDLLDLLRKEKADELPPHGCIDYEIPLIPGKQPGVGPIYGMNEEELKELRKYLDEELEKRFIVLSTSPARSPLLFIKKPGRGLRPCVDYRKINEITIKDRTPLSSTNDSLDRLSNAKISTKIDQRAAYNRIRSKDASHTLTTSTFTLTICRNTLFSYDEFLRNS